MNNEDIIQALEETLDIIHNVKHMENDLNISDQALNGAMMVLVRIIDNLEEGVERNYTMHDEELFEMLDHDRRFMAYNQWEINKQEEL